MQQQQQQQQQQLYLYPTSIYMLQKKLDKIWGAKKDKSTLLRLLINDYVYVKGSGTTHHTLLHKTFAHTKKIVQKERQQKKAKYASIKQRKAKACTKLSDNLYSATAEEAHKLIQDF